MSEEAQPVLMTDDTLAALISSEQVAAPEQSTDDDLIVIDESQRWQQAEQQQPQTVAVWTIADEELLVQLINEKTYISEQEKLEVQGLVIPWKDIEVPGHTTAECQEKYNEMVKCGSLKICDVAELQAEELASGVVTAQALATVTTAPSSSQPQSTTQSTHRAKRGRAWGLDEQRLLWHSFEAFIRARLPMGSTKTSPESAQNLDDGSYQKIALEVNSKFHFNRTWDSCKRKILEMQRHALATLERGVKTMPWDRQATGEPKEKKQKLGNESQYVGDRDATAAAEESAMRVPIAAAVAAADEMNDEESAEPIADLLDGGAEAESAPAVAPTRRRVRRRVQHGAGEQAAPPVEPNEVEQVPLRHFHAPAGHVPAAALQTTIAPVFRQQLSPRGSFVLRLQVFDRQGQFETRLLKIEPNCTFDGFKQKLRQKGITTNFVLHYIDLFGEEISVRDVDDWQLALSEFQRTLGHADRIGSEDNRLHAAIEPVQQHQKIMWTQI